MTKEEILKMEPGRELDALVAEKVMEIKLHWDDEEEQSYKIADSPFGEVLKAFNPSTDISAAWEVVEKMKSNNWWIVLSTEGDKWNALFYWDPNHEAIEAAADTAPEAICKASLIVCLEVE